MRNKFLLSTGLLTTVVVVVLILIFVAPQKFEASASVQMAMVANVPIETPAVLNEKIKLPLYFTEATLKSCIQDAHLQTKGSLAGTLKTEVVKNAPFLNISVRMDSPYQAKACLETVLMDIQTKQASYLAAPVFQNQNQQLEVQETSLVTPIYAAKQPVSFICGLVRC